MKVQPFEIPKSLHDSVIVQIDKSQLFFEHLHQHKEIQLSYIVEGQGKLFVSDSVHGFAPGDIFVVGGNTPHLFQSVKNKLPSHMISVFFTKESFGNGFLEIPELKEIHEFLKTSENSFRLTTEKSSVKKLLENLKNAVGLDKFIYFLRLIKKINHAETAPLTSYIHSKKISNEEGRRMRLVFDYVVNNFHNEIKLDDAAELIHMTPNAFCRFFKQRTNKTFFEFVIELRIEHACQLALNIENYSMSEIAHKSGFMTISNFNRKFKKLKGITPSEYRNKLKVVPF